MNFQDIQYFRKLYILKNFSKVAKFYNVSQPAISNSIKRLEILFDAKLMIRESSRKELIITPAGEQLFRHSITIINEFETAKKEIERLTAKNFNLGLASIIENTYFYKIAEKLNNKGLLNHIKIYESGSNSLRRSLEKGKIDAALIGSLNTEEFTETTQNDLIIQNFAASNFHIFVSKKHPLAQKKGVHFSELEDENFILLNQNFVHLKVAQILSKTNKLQLHEVLETNNVSFLMNMVSQNIGITILSEVAQNNYPDIVSIPLLDEVQPQLIASIAYRRNHYFTNEQKELLEFIADELGTEIIIQ
ncbi:LysR family transcriptional regulator [Liquorilactobacillus mali]|uniref:LysR family transcriptional regulator n=1 Tax=Liquorilactobacillus mali TaxID=1618 RepID=UPI00234FCFDC|nr:LysR family transcriptional regulator [Liquorilactobacillus mali]MDC7952869.1 LysR family transcriptional regulator [Liquorilactobacillus mali]